MRPVVRRRAAVIALALLVAAGCGGGDEGDEGAVTTVAGGASEGAAEPVAADAVQIVEFEFEPVAVTVAAGTTVTWTNGDEAIHSVADDALGFESEDLGQGDSFSFTYEEAGEFPYVCGIHDYMEGTVTVS